MHRALTKQLYCCKGSHEMKALVLTLLLSLMTGCVGYYDVQKVAIEEAAKTDRLHMESVKEVLAARANNSVAEGFKTKEVDKYKNAKQIITAYDNQPGIKEIYLGQDTHREGAAFQDDPLELIATAPVQKLDVRPHPAWQMTGDVLGAATPWLGVYGIADQMRRASGTTYMNSNNSVGGDMASAGYGNVGYTSTPTTTTQTDVGNDKSVVDNSGYRQGDKFAETHQEGADTRSAYTEDSRQSYNEGDQSVDSRTGYANNTATPTVVDPVVAQPATP